MGDDRGRLGGSVNQQLRVRSIGRHLFQGRGQRLGFSQVVAGL
jgi:hypothetical protein